ncbi:MAG: sensor histidine kinase [Citromicrobium sp.]|nr:MAG: sensor histidine kinase [Citromicrobium sp.]
MSKRDPLAHAITGPADEVREIDGPLRALNMTCGGAVGSTLAIPQLLELVKKSRDYGLKLSRQFEASDGENRILAWAEVTPLPEDQEGGCDIAITSWRMAPLPDVESNGLGISDDELYRNFAEFSARLDAEQCLLSAEASASDLMSLERQALDSVGEHWTVLCEFDGHQNARSLHWRMLDGARCSVAGSTRTWTAHISPLGADGFGDKGFSLHLVSDTGADDAHETDGNLLPSLGNDLIPVLRQPINRIIANAETIRTKLAGPLAPEYSDYAGDIAGAGQHLLALIDDLGDLEVVEADDFSTAPDVIDLAEVARQACGILGVRAKEKRIALVPPAEGEGQHATAEFRRVLQILLNLVGNAIRYSPEDSQIWVRLDRIGDHALVTVADQGHGLDSDQQSRVFEKFERLGRSDDGGSGLGLYISRRIARAMGGDLTVESAPGLGARFTLSVPAKG